MLPRLTSLIINNGVLEKNDPYIIKMGMIMVLIAAIMVVGGIGAAYYSAKASISFSTDLRKDIFHKVQEFSFKNIDDFSTGSLVTRLTNDIQQIQKRSHADTSYDVSGSGSAHRRTDHGIYNEPASGQHSSCGYSGAGHSDRHYPCNRISPI